MTIRQRVGIGAAVAAVVAVALWTSVFRDPAYGDAVVASGTVEGTTVDLGFQAPGRIDSIATREGDRVKAGAEIAWLDRRELLAWRRAAEAQLASARARLAELEAGSRPAELAQGRANLAAAEQRYQEIERSVARSRRLFEGAAVSREQLDREETALAVAKAQYETAREQVALLEEGPRAETIAAQRAAVRQAAAALDQIDAAMENTVIRAPFSGLVSVRHREPGEVIGAGVPVLTLLNPDDRWVRIFVREDEVGRLAIGRPATLSADAYPDERYGGEVVFIADEAEFTPRNVQTTEERVKLVFRIKVRIVEDPRHDLKPGLPADVRIEALER
jgi:HlyD family secretion protein